MKGRNILLFIVLLLVFSASIFFPHTKINGIVAFAEEETQEEIIIPPTDISQLAVTYLIGSGTEADPYIISSGDDLEFMAYQINAGASGYDSAFYKQTTNISIASKTWTSINSFAGSYDGQGYTIDGLYCSLTKNTVKHFAFIMTINAGATIKNVGFTNVNLSADTNAATDIATLAVNSSGTISNCFAKGSIYSVNDDTDDDLYAGGLIAYLNGGSVSNCYNAVNITAKSQAGVVVRKNMGGIVARQTNGEILNCYNIGTITNSNSMYYRISGIVSRWEGGTVNNCAVLTDTCKADGKNKNSFCNSSNLSTDNPSGSNNQVVSDSVLKSGTSAPLSSWEWNESNNFPRTWGFVSDSSSPYYNSGYPQLRVFYEVFTISFYSEDGTTVLGSKTTRYPEYAVNFEGIEAPNKKGHTFNGAFTNQTNSQGTKYDGAIGEVCSNIILYATYDINYYKLQITTSNGLAGTMTIRDELVAYNTEITAEVTQVNVGYGFLEWRDLSSNATLSKDMTYTFNMPDYDLSIYSYFSQETYYVRAAINDLSLGNVDGLYDYYTVGQTVTLTAMPGEGYRIDKFYLKDGTVLSTENTYTFTMQRDNLIVYVDFVKDKYTLNVEVYPSGVASLFGGGEYKHGEQVRLSFSGVQDGYEFACWKINELDKAQSDCSLEIFEFSMPAEDTTVYCYFLTNNLHYVTFYGLSDKVLSETIVQSGQTAIAPDANVEKGYNFVGWFDAKEGGNQITDFANVTNSIRLYARYEKIFDCRFKITFNITNNSDFYSDLNTSIFLNLRSETGTAYTLVMNNNQEREFKISEFGEYQIAIVLPTHYSAGVHINGELVNSGLFNVNKADEIIEINLYAVNNSNLFLYNSSNSFNSESAGSVVLNPSVSIGGEHIYNGVDSVVNKEGLGDISSEIIPNSPYGYEVKDVLGATNWGGLYNFTNLNYLVEGANFVGKDMGSTVYKFSFANHYGSMYPFNSENAWGDGYVNTMVDLAKTPAYQELFAMKEIKTFLMVAYEFVYCPWERVITNGYTLETMEIYYEHVRAEFADITEYLLLTYADNEKIFILSNWEGDNAYGAYFDMCTNDEQRQLLTDAYTGYINARQDGINRGRERIKNSTSKVYGNFEVCHIRQDIPYVPNRWRLTDVSVPYTYCDLYSFSDWYSYLQDGSGNYTFPIEELLDDLYHAVSQNLTFTNPEKYPQNPDFIGKKNIMVTEFGYDENTDPLFNEKIKHEIEAALGWGVYKLTYWGVYSNVRLVAGVDRPKNEDMQGLWLIRPDGTFTHAFWYMKSIITGKDYITNEPQIVFGVEYNTGVDFDKNKDNIIFIDDLTDTSKMKDHSEFSPESEDNRLLFYNIDPNSSDYQYFSEFNTYFGEVDLNGVIQSKNDDKLSYITYDMLTNKFGMLLYNYSDYNSYLNIDMSKIDELLILEGKNSSGEWVKIDNYVVKQTQSTQRPETSMYWYQSYISVETKVGEFSEIRISFANKKYNNWDPILLSVFFFGGGDYEN